MPLAGAPPLPPSGKPASCVAAAVPLPYLVGAPWTFLGSPRVAPRLGALIMAHTTPVVFAITKILVLVARLLKGLSSEDADTFLSHISVAIAEHQASLAARAADRSI